MSTIIKFHELSQHDMQSTFSSLVKHKNSGCRVNIFIEEEQIELENSHLGLSHQRLRKKSSTIDDLMIYKFADTPDSIEEWKSEVSVEQKEQSVKASQKMPKIHQKLLDLLYLQNSNEINPFIETLDELYNNKDDYPQRLKVEQLCYIGIGKNVLEYKKTRRPPYSRVNILIRQFMVDMMAEQVKELRTLYPEVIYLLCNDHALGFKINNVNNYRIFQLMEQVQYKKVILQINKIIQNHFLEFKKKKTIQINGYIQSSFLLGLLSIILMLYYIIAMPSFFFMQASWVLLILAVVLNIVGVLLKQRIYPTHNNIIDTIQSDIQVYLNLLNKKNRGYLWKCGVDFYWLQIHLNKKKQVIMETESQFTSN